MIFLGLDPDTQSMPVAAVNINGAPLMLNVASLGNKVVQRQAVIEMSGMLSDMLSGVDDWASTDQIAAVAVEGQEVAYASKTGKNPQSIVLLSAVAGAALGIAGGLWPKVPILFPSPNGWKGSTPKQIHQARVCKRLGWEFKKVGNQKDGYCVPLNANPLHSPQKAVWWKHGLDAYGLALWARDQYVASATLKGAKIGNVPLSALKGLGEFPRSAGAGLPPSTVHTH